MSTDPEAALRDVDEILAFRDVVAATDGSAGLIERARAHARLGVALRLAGRQLEARETLRLAVDQAHRSGAKDLEERAIRELRAAGGRPRRRLISGVGALTPSERRVAELAATGHLNREIAERLVVALTTVEFHLRNAYRKLGIASRAKLKEVLPAPPGAASRVFGGSIAALETGSSYRWERRSSAATSTSWARAR
jgi:ATP/maltotriose-dependent transcriptional regulator MalT